MQDPWIHTTRGPEITEDDPIANYKRELRKRLDKVGPPRFSPGDFAEASSKCPRCKEFATVDPGQCVYSQICASCGYRWPALEIEQKHAALLEQVTANLLNEQILLMLGKIVLGNRAILEQGKKATKILEDIERRSRGR